MRIGVVVPNRGIVMQSARRPAVEQCWEMARHCDDAGYHAVWVGDSVVAKPRLEPLTTLAYIAAMTMGLGPPEAVVAALRSYAEAGVTDLCIRFIGDDQRAQLERFTDEVLPALGDRP
jgi:alkanesulfonate monooxygenase SsuD/methylene tetrahydromethanopterin reductase-like flavin-dependent oxidoreductase (luciferase family)